jgi:hypothetical protein
VRRAALLARATCLVGGALLMLSLLALTACTSKDARASVPTKLAFCGGTPQARPAVVTVICTTNSITARDLTWSQWGQPIALATGTAVVDLCAYEDCHTGVYGASPIVLVASKVTRCPNGVRAYSRLQYVFVGRSPFEDVPANFKATNFMVGSHRSGPGNQSVSLTC